MDRKVIVTDPIARDGIDALAPLRPGRRQAGDSPDELLRVIGEYDALVVRSETKVTAEVIQPAKKLVVIGRAGAGVDNIDVEAATKRGHHRRQHAARQHHVRRGARHRPHALAVALHSAGECRPQGGKWERQRFMGVEVRGKTLGMVGLGQIGSEVARRARGLDMHVIACDPFVSDERAQSLIVEMVSLEDLLRQPTTSPSTRR